MYKITTYITCAFVISNLSIFAQVGIGTTTPDPSSVLDISSNNKGVLFPQLTSLERDAITEPSKGLFLFNIDENCFEYNSGSIENPVWKSTNSDNDIYSSDSVKYSNTSTSTNLNTAAFTKLKVFESLE